MCYGMSISGCGVCPTEKWTSLLAHFSSLYLTQWFNTGHLDGNKIFHFWYGIFLLEIGGIKGGMKDNGINYPTYKATVEGGPYWVIKRSSKMCGNYDEAIKLMVHIS